MSLITGCPACATLFRVVPDQLKISEGWVRCGHCGEVFDATSHLQDDIGAENAAAPEASLGAELQALDAPESAPLDHEGAITADSGPPLPLSAGEAGEASAGHETSDPLVLDDLPTAGPADGAPRDVDLDLDFRTAPPPDDRFDGDGYLPLTALRREAEASVPSRADAPDLDDLDDEVDEVLDDIGFVRQARRKAFWRRPGVLAALVLLALGLAALLAAQVAVHERDRLAATRPELRPWLETLCEPLHCRIGAPRRIDAIAIDSSGFTKLRADAYRLGFTLRNQASHPVALPALELTLTDTQDQAVLRRVLTPRELGATAETLAPNAEWSAAASLSVDAGAAGGRVAGYRLLAFYP